VGAHPEWNKHVFGPRQRRRAALFAAIKKTKKIVWVSPAILFPLMGAMSEFSTKDKKGRWCIQKPARFKEDEMVA